MRNGEIFENIYITTYFFILAVIVRIFLIRFCTIWRDVCLTKALEKKSSDFNILFIRAANFLFLFLNILMFSNPKFAPIIITSSAGAIIMRLDVTNNMNAF